MTDYDGGLLYGLEADAMSWQQLTDAFAAVVAIHLDVPAIESCADASRPSSLGS